MPLKESEKKVTKKYKYVDEGEKYEKFGYKTSQKIENRTSRSPFAPDRQKNVYFKRNY